MKNNDNNFISYQIVDELLKNNCFFPITGKRIDKYKILYTYHSIKYPTTTIQVLTTKLNPNKIPSDKIILGTKLNNNEINGWNELVNKLNEIHKKKRKLNNNNEQNNINKN